MSDTIVNGVEIRNVSITSNNFYGLNDFCNNMLPMNENFVTIRIFQIDLLGIICGNNVDRLVKVVNENFYLETCYYEVF